MVDLDRLLVELQACARDAGLDAGSFVVHVVEARRPPGTTPMAYLQPAGYVWPDTVAVFRAVGAERVHRHHLSAHRLALWGDLDSLPVEALGPMLRHEVEHARRWERSGTAFFEADDLLRAAVRAGGGWGYSALPSEREANLAARAYAERSLSAAEYGVLAACAECEALVAATPDGEDVVAETLAALAARVDWGGFTTAAERSGYLREVERACAAWGPTEARTLLRTAAEPLVETVAVP